MEEIAKPTVSEYETIEMLNSLSFMYINYYTNSELLQKDKEKISASAWTILGFAEYTDLRMDQVARLLNVSKSTATDYIDVLERKGLIRRVKGTKDKRMIFAKITRKGKYRLYSREEYKRSFFIDCLSRLEEDERSTFIKLLSKFSGYDDKKEIHAHIIELMNTGWESQRKIERS